MNIALVVHDLHDHGGHSAYAKILADGLSAQNQVHVFANRCERPDDARWQSTRVWATRGSALATVQTFPIGLRSHSAELAGYDIRHMQGYCGGKPNVVTAHICVSAYLDSLRSISLTNRASLKLMAAAERRFYRRYEGQVIAISNKIAGELHEFYEVPGEIAVIPHGVDSARVVSAQPEQDRVAVRSELGIDEEQKLALYVGDLTKAHVHLEALTRAAPQIQFIIVTGSTAYHWAAPNLHILPPTSQLDRYYAAADAFVFPTTYDAFGMVVLEAMAAGLAVFSSDCAGAAELIDPGKDGFVFPLNEWVETTISHLNDGNSLRLIGDSARQTARAHDWEKVINEVELVYSHAIDRN